MFIEAIKLALRSVRRNVLRSVLTLLGIMIGVASVIALVTIGSGTNNLVSGEIAKLGSNLLFVTPAKEQRGPPGAEPDRPFNERDVEALRTGTTHVRTMTPFLQARMKVLYDGNSTDTDVMGTDENYFDVQNWTIGKGTAFDAADARAAATNCVIGETVEKNLFVSRSPLGQTLRIKNLPCVVIGVLKSKGKSSFGDDPDNAVVIPIRTMQRRILGNNKMGIVLASVKSVAEIKPAIDEMKVILRDTRRISDTQEDDFTVHDLTQIAGTFSATMAVLTGLLSMVAAVSLLVGGIGIMNIMLVSVTERTREIGIRIAIGALASQVLLQFLVEAVVLCLIGGALGIVLGLSLAGVASYFLSIPFSPSLPTILLAFGFSGVIGLVFGFFPARNAAKLDPIDALRHE